MCSSEAPSQGHQVTPLNSKACQENQAGMGLYAAPISSIVLLFFVPLTVLTIMIN